MVPAGARPDGVCMGMYGVWRVNLAHHHQVLCRARQAHAATGRSIILASSKIHAVRLLAGSVHQALTDLVIVLLRPPACARRLCNCGITNPRSTVFQQDNILFPLTKNTRVSPSPSGPLLAPFLDVLTAG